MDGCVQAADSNGTLPESRTSNTGRGGPASTSSDTGLALDLDTDSPYISLRGSRQNSLQDSGPASKDVELEASVLDTLTDSVLTGAPHHSGNVISLILPGEHTLGLHPHALGAGAVQWGFSINTCRELRSLP